MATCMVCVAGSALGILGLVLVALKLLRLITWSWLWVAAPFWAPLMVGLLGFVSLLLAVVFVKAVR